MVDKGRTQIATWIRVNAETRRKFRRHRTGGISVIEFEPTACPSGKVRAENRRAKATGGETETDGDARRREKADVCKRESFVARVTECGMTATFPMCTVASFNKIIPPLFPSCARSRKPGTTFRRSVTKSLQSRESREDSRDNCDAK